MLGWEQKLREARNEKGGDGEKRKPLIPSPLTSFILFCCRSNFGAITRLETLTTPANKAQDLTTSNDYHNSLMIHQEPLPWALGFTLSPSRCLLFLLKGKCTEAATAIRRSSTSMTDLTYLWFRVLFCERMAWHLNLCSVNTMCSKCYISSICQKKNTIVTYLLIIIIVPW